MKFIQEDLQGKLIIWKRLKSWKADEDWIEGLPGASVEKQGGLQPELNSGEGKYVHWVVKNGQETSLILYDVKNHLFWDFFCKFSPNSCF